MHSALPGAHGWRAATGANGFSSQHDTRLHFGLGASASALVPIRIRWCGGATKEHRLTRDGYRVVRQGGKLNTPKL